jgi:Skp family chaperone for outer membrane proteins
VKLTKTILTVAAIIGLGIAAQAQQPPATPQTGSPATAPKGKVAFINTAAFQDQIGEFKAKIDTLNRQFEARVKEVQTKADRIGALETTIKTQSQVLGAAKVAEMTEQLEREKRDYQRKAEDLEADGNRARDLMLGPIREKLSKFVEGYTQRRGITMLWDLGNALQSNILLWYDTRADVTADFIREYNKANPATGTPAPPQ